MLRYAGNMRAIPAFFCPIAALAVNTATCLAYATEPTPRTPEPSSGPMVGAALSYFSPVLSGSLAPPGLGAGPAVGVSAGYRWAFLYFGAAYQHAFLAGATYQQDVETGRTLSASSDYLGFDLAAITRPDAVTAAFFRVGVGGRLIRATGTLDGVPDPPTSTTNVDLLVGIGVQVKASDWLRIVPQFSFEAGPLNAYASLGVTTYFDFAKPAR